LNNNKNINSSINDNQNYKEKLNMIYDNSNDDNDKYNFYEPELGIYKIIRNNNDDLQKIIYKNTNDENDNYHNQANLIFNNLIKKWNTYNENYIDIHGFDYFEKHYLFDKKYYEESIEDESDIESNYETDNSINEEEYYY
jgi:hypothetical protein